MPVPIKIFFIGTGGVSSFGSRNLPSISIKVSNELIILDAGEGCQYSIFRQKLHPVKSKLYILLTHLHTDHVNGLPGILHTLSLAQKKDVVKIFGPVGTKDFVNKIIDAFNIYPLPFIIDVREIAHYNPLTHIASTSIFNIIAFKTYHDVAATGYILVERTRPSLNATKVQSLGIPLEMRKKLLAGEIIKLDNGRIIKPEDVLEPPKHGRKIIYTGDTRPINDQVIIEKMKNADLLIHESTFIRKFHAELAINRFHSTVEDAIEFALLVKAKNLALFHISPRYKDIDLIKEIVIETLEKLDAVGKLNVFIPNDGDIFFL